MRRLTKKLRQHLYEASRCEPKQETLLLLGRDAAMIEVELAHLERENVLLRKQLDDKRWELKQERRRR